jgi:tRNA A37 threonylcarbamoyladenosine synthetase subunit TsaC/SUA5/YrdC
VAAFGPLVDLIVDAGDRGEGVASTIVDLTVVPGRVVRQGALRVPDALLAG